MYIVYSVLRLSNSIGIRKCKKCAVWREREREREEGRKRNKGGEKSGWDVSYRTPGYALHTPAAIVDTPP